MQDVRCQLYDKDEDFAVFKCIQRQVKDAEERLAEGRAVVICLQSQLTNLACDDPGAAVSAQLALPILQVGHSRIDEVCCGTHEPCAALSPGQMTWTSRPLGPPKAECILALQGLKGLRSSDVLHCSV